MKSIRAHDENTSNSKHLANCYDKMANEVDKAIYHSSTNFEDGCNITYIMEDVKVIIKNLTPQHCSCFIKIQST